MSHSTSTLNELNASFGGKSGGYHNERLKGTTYDVEIGGNKVGTISESKHSSLKYHYKPRGYTITTSIMGSHLYIIDEEKNKIADISYNGFYDTYYIITIEKPEMELEAVLILLAIKGEKIEMKEWEK